jgi:hypothetical protein
MLRFALSLAVLCGSVSLGCGSRCFSDRDPAEHVFRYEELAQGRVSACEQGDHWTGSIPPGRHRFVFSTTKGAIVLVRVPDGDRLGPYVCGQTDASSSSCVSYETDGRTIEMVFDTTGGEAVVDVNQGGPCTGIYLECGSSDPYNFKFKSCSGCGPRTPPP